ncbi:MAG: restriction endonuclease subunit S [Chloroflexota bacterium]|nr:restriction endonuclease subunit S [Chloroflexota bacterium]
MTADESSSSATTFMRTDSVDGSLSNTYMIGHGRVRLPKEWQVKPLSAVASIKTGPFGSSLHESDYVEDGTPIITVEHLSGQGVIHSGLPLVSDDDRKRLAAYELRTNDIVFSRVGSIDRSSLVSDTEDGWLFSGRLLRVRTSKDTHAPYLNYHFADEIFKRQVRNVAVGQTMASLNTKILGDVFVILPPLPEQRAIAAALSDADSLIGALDALIAKKQSVKQATMQRLLAGETRLPGFLGEWETRRLGDLGKFAKGSDIARNDLSSDGFPCILYGELYTRYDNYIVNPISKVSVDTAQAALPIGQGDLLFAGSGETIEDIGRCAAYLGSSTAYAGGDIIVLTPSEGNSLYLSHLLNHGSVSEQKARMGHGATIAHINSSSLAHIEVWFPPIPEQHAIAAVLSDMDAEIAALQERRDKTIALKEGMMQELLTGNTRLPEAKE